MYLTKQSPTLTKTKMQHLRGAAILVPWRKVDIGDLPNWVGSWFPHLMYPPQQGFCHVCPNNLPLSQVSITLANTHVYTRLNPIYQTTIGSDLFFYNKLATLGGDLNQWWWVEGYHSGF
jgi:hypothetical protein